MPRTSTPTHRTRAALAWLVALVVLVAPGAARAQTDGGGAMDASSAPEAGAGRMVAPVLVERAHPVYPDGADGRRVDVELLLTLDAQGQVAQAEVLGHIPADAPESFDVAARDAARTLRFEPARIDGQPSAVRLRFHMAIVPPVVPSDASPGADAAAPPEADELGSGAEGLTHTHAPTDAGVAPATDAAVTLRADAAAPTHAPAPTRSSDEQLAEVHADRVPEVRGGSDVYQAVGALRSVPRTNASGLLELAPGILLTNEGGQGHAEQVYLRGFDAREGQDLEFTVNGVPFNEPGNPHGEGLANTHFIIPELVHAVRVLEGPFDPHQGNYAVAGSADFELGLDQRGLTLGYTGGSFNTHRVLATWGPEDGRRGTFAGVDLETTDGFGTNRAARYGRAMAQWEVALGATTVARILASTYLTQYSSAGVLRADDYDAGRIGFYGSYDPTQGGDEGRHVVALTLEDTRPDRVLRQQIFGSLRTMRLVENYTGFLEDPPAAYRTGVAQRGDAVDQNEAATTLGGRGSARLRTTWHGLVQAIEAGYFGRYDAVDSSQRRLRFGTTTPYRVDFDLTEAIANVGLYLDTELRPFRWLVVRGGVRGDYFSYDVLDHCALHDTSLGSSATASVVDMLCYNRDRTGPIDTTTRRSASGLAIQPRGAVLLGPFRDLTFTASAGNGARSADPSYLGQGNFAPFASVFAAEGGAIFARHFGAVGLSARAVYYYTHVGQDLIFNEQAGRNTLAPGTVRQGALVAARLSGPWFDWNASATYADARFDRQPMDPGATYFPPDQGDRVPYVPNWVVRTDAAAYGPLPFRWAVVAGDRLRVRAGVGFTYVSPRALPFNEFGDPLYLLDASVGVRWRNVEIGAIGQNLLGLQYRLAEYNYVSDFVANNPTPNMVPARTFVAGAPLAIYGTLTVYFGARAAATAGAR